MLKLYRRHVKSCPHRSMTYRRCTCPVWVFGSVQGRRVRQALDTVNWSRAEDRLRELLLDEVPDRVTLAEAGARFLSDCESRKLAAETTGKYRLMIAEMKACLGAVELRAITVDDLARYRETWKASPITAIKKLERLRAFFRFCVERGWARFNPAVGLKKPKVKFRPTLPFTVDETEKILWATEVYPIKGIYGEGNRQRLRAFVRLLLFSGLRIRDAVMLDYYRVADSKLLIYTQKTGQAVYVPLPESVIDDLAVLVRTSSSCFFWSGLGNPKSAVGDWQRSLRKLFKLARVEHGHAHRFRDTFAVRLLEKGVTLENVAVLLGNSIKVAERHYSPWVKSRQDALEESIKKGWTI